jgi:glycogen operon protein
MVHPTCKYDSDLILIDPYSLRFRQPQINKYSARLANSRHSLIARDNYDWEDDQPLNIPLADSIIYELHVRGFTRHPTAEVRQPGTFQGLIEKIPYLQELGITAVELLPINEFDETHNDKVNPLIAKPLLNLGYDSIAFLPEVFYESTTTGHQIYDSNIWLKHCVGRRGNSGYCL